MNVTQYYLCKIAEECAEVSQRAMKAQQFGLEEIQQGQDLNNLERLVLEYYDLVITFENFMLRADSGVSVRPNHDKRASRTTKMLKFLELSKSLNQVDEDVEV